MYFLASLNCAHSNGVHTHSYHNINGNHVGKRSVSGPWIVAAFLAVTACAPALDSNERFVCIGTCTALKADVVASCTKQPKISPLGLVNAEQAFKKCLADAGYVDGRFIASDAIPVQPQLASVKKDIEEETRTAKAIAQKPVLNSRISKTSTAKPAVTSSTRKKNIRRKSKRIAQKPQIVTQTSNTVSKSSNIVTQEPAEFDPQDLFKSPPDLISSTGKTTSNTKSKTSRSN